MRWGTPLLIALVAAARLASGMDDAPETLRVDVQVMGGKGLPLSDLRAEDFELRIDDQVQPLKGFVPEGAPLDVLLVVDVSYPMKPYVKRLYEAIGDALRPLKKQDRVAILAFDLNARPMLPFTADHAQVASALNALAQMGPFASGARISSALIFASSYLARHARPEARRAVVILTGNASQDNNDEARVLAALGRADASLSFLFPSEEKKKVDEDGNPVPEEKGKRHKRTGKPPELIHAAPLMEAHAAGTEVIAQDAGGEAVVFEDEGDLEDALVHLKQRYTLRFSGPLKETLKLDLAKQARERSPEAAVHFRQLYQPGAGVEQILTPFTAPHEEPPATNKKKSRAVNEEPN